MQEIVPSEMILTKIYLIRGIKVIIDRDLAKHYEVDTRTLKQAVRRKIDRFPDDFMFEMTKEEFKNWRSQIVISNNDKIGLRHSPMVFTELGIAMLSSILNSERAIKVNIQIMRAFTQLRNMIQSHEDLRNKIETLEKQYDKQFRIVFDAIRELLEVRENPKSNINKIGFNVRDGKKK